MKIDTLQETHIFLGQNH